MSDNIYRAFLEESRGRPDSDRMIETFLRRMLPDVATIKQEAWQEELEKQLVDKEDLNNLIMDFLVSEECREAAEAFQQEANVTGSLDSPASKSYLLELQDQVNKKIGDRDAQGIEDILNKVNPKILEENREIRAELVLLRLLGKVCSQEEASDSFGFACDVVCPEVRSQVRPGHQPKLERVFESVLGLLVFADPAQHPDYPAVLAWQATLGAKCKKAIKQSESLSQEPKLVKIIKLMKFLESKLALKANFPAMASIETGQLQMTQQALPLLQRSLFNP